jgi:hypothetical protein
MSAVVRDLLSTNTREGRLDLIDPESIADPSLVEAEGPCVAAAEVSR